MKVFKVIKLKDGSQFTVTYDEQVVSKEQESMSMLSAMAFGFPLVIMLVEYLGK